jgi:hypothetical protein
MIPNNNNNNMGFLLDWMLCNQRWLNDKVMEDKWLGNVTLSELSVHIFIEIEVLSSSIIY